MTDTSSPNDGLACPQCEHTDIKKNFLGGSRNACVVVILIGIVFTFILNGGKNPDMFDYGLFAIFVVAGLAGLMIKRYRCMNCQRGFNTPSKSRADAISEMMFRASKVDYRGDWDDAIAIYKKVKVLGDDDEASRAQKCIDRIESKKADAAS